MLLAAAAPGWFGRGQGRVPDVRELVSSLIPVHRGTFPEFSYLNGFFNPPTLHPLLSINDGDVVPVHDVVIFS